MWNKFSPAKKYFKFFQLLNSIIWMFGDIWKNQYMSKKWKIENVPNNMVKV